MYYGGYQGGYNSGCGCGGQGGYSYPMYNYGCGCGSQGGYGGYGYSPAIILVLFILLVIIIGSRVVA